jgi:hypothetical protein
VKTNILKVCKLSVLSCLSENVEFLISVGKVEVYITPLARQHRPYRRMGRDIASTLDALLKGSGDAVQGSHLRWGPTRFEDLRRASNLIIWECRPEDGGPVYVLIQKRTDEPIAWDHHLRLEWEKNEE